MHLVYKTACITNSDYIRVFCCYCYCFLITFLLEVVTFLLINIAKYVK